MKQLTFPQVLSAHTTIVTGLMLCVAMATLTRHVQLIGHEGILEPAGQVTPDRTAEQDFTSRFEADFVGRPESVSTPEPYRRYQLKSVYYFFKDGQLVLTSRTSNPDL